MATLNLDRFNERIRSWGKSTVKSMQQSGDAAGIVHRSDSPSNGPSLKKLKDGYREQDGAINRISIKMRRTLVYTHKGAGKGRGGSKGSRWIDKYGNTKSTNPKSFGKMATGGRKAKPFFNQVLESTAGVDEVASIAAEELGDAIVNNMLIK